MHSVTVGGDLQELITVSPECNGAEKLLCREDIEYYVIRHLFIASKLGPQMAGVKLMLNRIVYGH